MLVDGNTGVVTRKRVFDAPVMDGAVQYLDVSERFTSTDRFYPEYLEDLPAAGAWPLRFESSDIPVPAAPANEKVAVLPEGFSIIPTAFAETPATQEPCVNIRKVGVVITGERPDSISKGGNDEGKDFIFDTANVGGMMQQNLGFAPKDIHRYNPESHPKLKDVFDDIAQLTKDLGPCDKFFLYITGHGSVPDKNGNGQPDSPSSYIAYRALEEKQYISKTRGDEYSLIRLLESIRAGHINLMIDSCFSGSLQEIVNQQVANPATGSTWNVFLASPSDQPSYSMTERSGSEYTDAIAYCIRIRLVERGIKNPTIEQMEEVMKECQEKVSRNPADYGLTSTPPTTLSVTPMTITVSPEDARVTEGDSGVTYVEFTITRTPTDRAITVKWKTYDPFPKSEEPNYPGRQDYGWNKDGQDIIFAPGESTKTIRIPVYGDTEIEEDETFGVWFPGLGTTRRVTIIDDDKLVVASSSASSTAASSDDTSVTITMDPVKVDLSGLSGISMGLDYSLTGGKPTINWTEEYVIVDDGSAKQVTEPETDCPNCDEIVDVIIATAWDCNENALKLKAVQARSAELQRQITEADAAVKDAEKRLNSFDTPKSSATSDGRTVTSTDLAVTREFNRQTWNTYKNGDATAQETSDTWGKGPNAEGRERIRKELRDALQAQIDAARERLDNLRGRLVDAQQEIDDLIVEQEECEKELDDLFLDLEECEKLCTRVSSEDSQVSEGTDQASSEPEEDNSSVSSSPTESDDGKMDMQPEDEETETDMGWPCEWFGLFCPDDATDDEASDVADTSSKETSSSSEEKAECDKGTLPEGACKAACIGQCVESYMDFAGLRCFTCAGKLDPQDLCPAPTEPQAECRETCIGSCVKKSSKNNVDCYECVAPPSSSSSRKESSPSALKCEETSFERAECDKTCDGSCVAAIVRTDGVTCYTCVSDKQNPCPLGTTPDQVKCDSLCRPEGGVCKKTDGCYSCVFPEPEEKQVPTSGPAVTSTSPGNGSTGVPVDVRPRIIFSVPMLRSALETAIGASFPYTFVQVNDTTIDLVPSGSLEYDKSYDFRVSASATDKKGARLPQTVAVQFRTQKSPSETPPRDSPASTTPAPPPTDSAKTSSAASSSKSSSPQAPKSSSPAKPTVQVLILGGKKYPVSQFVIEDHDACTAHYHAANGFQVVSLDSSSLPEPGGCTGYGKTPDVPKQTCATDGTECQQ